MIINLIPQDANHVALIHTGALKGDFLPSLGFNFLSTFYSGVLGKPGVYGFGYKDKGQVIGFVVGTSDSSIFFHLALKAKFLEVSFYLLLQLLKKPSLIKNVLETFLYTSKDKGPKAELVVIAVENSWQGRGIGRKLTEALEEAFSREGIKEYKLTVHADKKAVQFYEHLKYNRISEFSLYGKLWYVFSKKLKNSWPRGRKKN